MPLYLVFFCRFILIIVFGISFLNKVRNFIAFENTISSFKLFPETLSKSFAFFVLTGEIAIVALLLSNHTGQVIGFAIAICLLSIFCVAFTSILNRRIKTSCNCFGPSQENISTYDIWRNVCLILCALIGIAASTVKPTTLDTDFSLPQEGLLILGAVIFGLIWLNFSDIVALFTNNSL